jgi:hypothetical protein
MAPAVYGGCEILRGMGRWFGKRAVSDRIRDEEV